MLWGLITRIPYAQRGILVSGASGAGKTIAAKVIVEDCLKMKYLF
jgi:myosin heavy subunit